MKNFFNKIKKTIFPLVNTQDFTTPLFYVNKKDFLTPILNAKTRHLISKKKGYGKASCYYIGINKHTDISNVININLVPLCSWEINNELKLFAVSRNYAEKIIAFLQSELPDLFADESGHMCKDILQFHLQYHLANYEIYLYTQYFKPNQAGQGFYLYKTINVIDSVLNKRMLNALLNDLGLNSRRTCIQTLYTQRANTEASHIIDRLLTSSTTKDIEFPFQGGVMFVLTANSYVKRLCPIIEALVEHAPVYLLIDRTVSLDPSWLTMITAKNPVHCMYLDLELPEASMQRVKEFFIKAFKQIKECRLKLDDKSFCLLHLLTISTLLKNINSIIYLLDRIQPECVIGCFEVNKFGLIFSKLREHYSYKLINIQHGNVERRQTLDYFYFDYWLTWNLHSQNVILKDGYAHPETLVLLGNPEWEWQQQVSDRPYSKDCQDLLNWKGADKVIGAYTQYLRGYATPESKRKFITALLNYLRQRQDVKLIIRKHPAEDDTLCETLVAQSDVSDRVKIVSYLSIPLQESFMLADVVTSIFSTVLMDAVSVGKPVVSLDLESVLARQELGFDGAVVIVNDEAHVQPVFDALLFPDHYPAHPLLSAVTAERIQALVPRFDSPYPERLKQFFRRAMPLKSPTYPLVGDPVPFYKPNSQLSS